MKSTHLPDDGVLQAYLDGELPESERSLVEAHVRACVDCARGLDELRAASAALQALVGRDTPARAADPVVPHPAFLKSRPRRPAARSIARAAGLVALLAGSAAVLEATTGWIGAAVRAVRGDVEAPAPAGSVESVGPAEDALFTVQPRGGTLEVILDELTPRTRVTVRVGDTDVGEVRIRDGAEGVAYRAGPGSATAVAPGVSEIEVLLPATLLSGRVVVNGETAIVKAADRLFSVLDAEEIERGFRFRIPR